MNRTLIALLAALESFLAVAIGVGISLVPLSIMWAARLDLDIGWDVFWRASADIWLVGHGVDLTITLEPTLAAAIGLPGAELPFLVSIAPLSFALITILMGVRLGRKSLESGARFVGPVAAISTFGGLTVLIALSALQTSAMPTLWMALSFPTAFFALGLVIGARGEVGHSGGRAERVQKRVVGWASGLSQQVRVVLATAVRGGVIVATSVIAFSAITLAILIIGNFSTILGLYEGLQGGGGGSLILTAAQLMFMPNFVIWVASWFIGTGFALGTGSLVSPVGTDLGLLPSLPVLGALPTADMAFGFLGLLVPIAAAFIAGLMLRPKLVAPQASSCPGKRATVALDLCRSARHCSGRWIPHRFHELGQRGSRRSWPTDGRRTERASDRRHRGHRILHCCQFGHAGQLTVRQPRPP
ncbi:MAG: hypothetical protein RLZZ52_919 [Actinomycetota bacterium]